MNLRKSPTAVHVTNVIDKMQHRPVPVDFVSPYYYHCPISAFRMVPLRFSQKPLSAIDADQLYQQPLPAMQRLMQSRLRTAMMKRPESVVVRLGKGVA